MPKNDNPWSDACLELLKLWRGKSSQEQLSKKMGFKSNLISAWELGKRKISADNAFLLLESKGKRIDTIVKKFLGYTPPWLKFQKLSTQEGVAFFLASQLGQQKPQSLAGKINKSRFTLGRYYTGEIGLNFEDFLWLLNLTSHRTLDFLSLCCDLNSTQTLSQQWQRHSAQRSLSHNPNIYFLMMLFEMYPNQTPTKILKTLPFEQRKELNKALDQLKGVFKFKTANHLLNNDNLDLRPDPKGAFAFRKWCLEQSQKKLKEIKLQPSEGNIFSCNLFNISKEAKLNIEKHHRSYFKKVSEIISNDNAPPQEQCIVNVHLFSINAK